MRRLRRQLVNRPVDPRAWDEAVDAYAQMICKNSAESNMTLKAMTKLYGAGQREESAATQEMFLERFSSEHFKEGFNAFLKKRRPKF